MNTRIVNELLPIDLAEYRKRGAKDSDTNELISEPTRWVDQTGKPIVVYTRVDPLMLAGLRNALLQVKYAESTRSGGMVSRSRIFGYSPRIAVRNLACRLVSLASDQPDQHQEICKAGRIAWNEYQRYNPDLAGNHSKLTAEHVLDQWKIHSTPFTSGIANHNNPLVYHFDSGNFKNVWSAMFVLKHGVSGGHLSIPELGIRLECSDSSLVLFDGQSLLHGVTPIIKHSPNSYRYSVVYYSLQGMWHCQTITDELIKMRQGRTEIEQRRAGLRK